MWLNGQDPEFEAKQTEIIGLYMDPAENALVLSVDERTGMQALGRKYPNKPMRPGHPEKIESHYVRYGTKSLIAALVVHKGEVTGKCYGRIKFHFTPTHASWLNQIELWFSILSRKVLKRGIFSSREDLVERVMKFIEEYNQEARPFKWTYKGDPLKV